MPERAYPAALVVGVLTAAVFAPLLRYDFALLDPIVFDVPFLSPRANLALHALNTALVLLLLARCTGRLMPSLLAALLFAGHPLRVESIAWIDSRDDMRMLTAVLVTVLAYESWARRRGWWRYAIALAPYGLAVRTTAAPWLAAPIPLVLLLLDAWPLGRLDVTAPAYDPRLARRLVEKLPFALLAGASFAWAAGAASPLVSEPTALGAQFANAFANVVRYVGMTVLPLALTPLRPVTAPPWWAPGAVLGVVAATAAVLGVRRRAPALTIGWLWFLVTLLPVVSATPADRASYLPSVGLAIVLAGTVASFDRHRFAVAATALVALGACVLATEHQIRTWRDEETVLRHALAVTQDNFAAEVGLGTRLVAHGAWEEAAPHAAEAVRLRPDDADALNALGEVRLHDGHVDAAAEHFARAVAVRPDHVRARFNLGRAEQQRGRIDEAIAAYRGAVERSPDEAYGYGQLGRALRQRGNLVEARAMLERALALGARPTDVLGSLAQTLAEAGDLDGAVARYRELLTLAPDDASAHDRLGTLAARGGDLATAEAEYRAALRLRPDLADAQLHLGTVLAARGALDEALAAYDAALAITPRLPSAHYNRALALEAQGNPTAARAALRAELDLQPNWPPALVRLAALLAEGGETERSEARRLVDQAAVSLGEDDPDVQAVRRLVQNPHGTADSP